MPVSSNMAPVQNVQPVQPVQLKQNSQVQIVQAPVMITNVVQSQAQPALTD